MESLIDYLWYSAIYISGLKNINLSRHQT